MAINEKLFRKIRNKILRVPEAYKQDTYGERARTPCGTRACIAGHALLESGYCTPIELFNLRRVNPETGEREFIDVEEEASELLGIGYWDGVMLFGLYGNDWAEPYRTRFAEAKTKEARARVAADYINWIIKTGKVS